MFCEFNENKDLLKNLLKTNLLPLAFIGDSVHTLYIREKILKENSQNKMSNYHSLASKFCKASSQAKSLKFILPFLNEEELDIVRRGRNAKPKHHAKNATNSDYSFATAFEILIGFLYLSGDKQKLEYILNLSLNV